MSVVLILFTGKEDKFKHLVDQLMILIPGKEAIIYHNFVKGIDPHCDKLKFKAILTKAKECLVMTKHVRHWKLEKSWDQGHGLYTS